MVQQTVQTNAGAFACMVLQQRRACMRRWFSFFLVTLMEPSTASPGAQSMGGCKQKVCWPQCVAPVGSGAVDRDTCQKHTPVMAHTFTLIVTLLPVKSRSAEALYEGG